jgi:hypothetical protein
MAVFNNGSITATVTPPQGYSGSYSYELFKYDNGSWVTVTAAAEGYNANLFINPISTNATTYTFGNPDGFDDNIEGSNTWRGLKPAQYKVVVTTLTGLTCGVDGTATVGSDDPTDPCYGFNILASVDSDTAITVTVVGGTASFTWTLNGSGAAAFDNGDGTFTFNNLTPSTFYTIGVVDANSCTDSVTATTTGAVDPEFTCTDANFQVADGVEGETIQIGVDATVDAGTLNSVSPSTYSPGTDIEYTANITVPSAGYSNNGATITTCTDTASTTVDPCAGFNGIQVTSSANPTAGNSDGSITVEVLGGSGSYTWTLNGNATTPTDNGDATFTFSGLSAAEGAGTQYTIALTDASCGTANTQQTLVDPGTPPSGNITWYWFHSLDRDWLRYGSSYTLCTAPSYFLRDGSGGANGSTTNISEAMQYYFDNQASIDNGSEIQTIEFAGPISGNSGVQEFVFPELTGGVADGDYFIMVPATADFPEDLTAANITVMPSPGQPGNAFEKINVTLNGEDYILYQLQGSASSASRTCTFE